MARPRVRTASAIIPPLPGRAAACREAVAKSPPRKRISEHQLAADDDEQRGEAGAKHVSGTRADSMLPSQIPGSDPSNSEPSSVQSTVPR